MRVAFHAEASLRLLTSRRSSLLACAGDKGRHPAGRMATLVAARASKAPNLGILARRIVASVVFGRKDATEVAILFAG